MPSLSDMIGLFFSGVSTVFQIQADFWDEFGIFPTFILLFVATTFFRYIVLRMYGAGEAGASDYVSSRSAKAEKVRQQKYRSTQLYKDRVKR